MNKTKPIVLIDQDGVLASWDDVFYAKCLAKDIKFDIEHPHHQRHRYFTDHIPDKHQRNEARRMVNHPSWFPELPVIEGAQEGMAELDKHCEVWICSKPLESNKSCHQDKQDWITKHFPAFSDRLILTGDKSLIVGDILLDDAPKLKWFKRAKWQPVIYTQHFNAHKESPLYDMARFTWDDPVEYLIELAEAAKRGEEI